MAILVVMAVVTGTAPPTTKKDRSPRTLIDIWTKLERY